jgi:hypothetical protein
MVSIGIHNAIRRPLQLLIPSLSYSYIPHLLTLPTEYLNYKLNMTHKARHLRREEGIDKGACHHSNIRRALRGRTQLAVTVTVAVKCTLSVTT